MLQSRARIDRVRAVSGWWGGAHSFQSTLKMRIPMAASSVRKDRPETAKSGARASERCAQGTRQRHWLRGFEASSAPPEADEDAEQLGDPGRDRTSATQQAGWPPNQGAESEMCQDQTQCNLGVPQCAEEDRAMRARIAPHAARALPTHLRMHVCAPRALNRAWRMYAEL